jgi:peptidyl-prolyl cis-trans isomerase SurA
LEDPVLYFTIDTMAVGNITKPIRFEDPREGIKVRILYYQAKYPAHRANLQDDYEKLKAATLRRKEDEILEKWFVTAKEDVFIDIDPIYDRCNPLQGK